MTSLFKFFNDQLKSPGKPTHNEKQFYGSLEVDDADNKKELIDIQQLYNDIPIAIYTLYH